MPTTLHFRLPNFDSGTSSELVSQVILMAGKLVGNFVSYGKFGQWLNHQESDDFWFRPVDFIVSSDRTRINVRETINKIVKLINTKLQSTVFQPPSYSKRDMIF